MLLYYAFPAAVAVLYGIRKYRESKWANCSNSVRLDGKIVIITGANSGIGYETAKELVSRGAIVIFACRNEKLTVEAMETIDYSSGHRPVYIHLDLSSIASIKDFANEIKLRYRKVDILINNAGVSYPKGTRKFTEDDIEIHFGVNYLGHFLLTNLLLSHIEQSDYARIINVSSLLHQKGTLTFDAVEVGKNSYADSKLAMMYFGRELSKRVEKAHVYSLCPGWVYTNLFRHSRKRLILMSVFILPVAFLFMRNKRQGAQTVIYCATEPSIANESGYFYRDCGRFVSQHQFTEENGRKLWDFTLEVLKNKGVAI